LSDHDLALKEKKERERESQIKLDIDSPNFYAQKGGEGGGGSMVVNLMPETHQQHY
jgi:hypothetical protein